MTSYITESVKAKEFGEALRQEFRPLCFFAFLRFLQFPKAGRDAGRETDRDRQRQADRPTDRPTDRQTDRLPHYHI